MVNDRVENSDLYLGTRNRESLKTEASLGSYSVTERRVECAAISCEALRWEDVALFAVAAPAGVDIGECSSIVP